MKRLARILERIYHHHTKKKWDSVYIIDGDEGVSKSTLALHLTDLWYTKHKGKVEESDIKHIALDKLQFAEDLRDLKKFEMLTYDEAGDISNRRAMSKFNFLITQAYQVIRGDNLFTILVLPSVFDLDPFFTKRRARALIHVYARGRCKFYNRERLRKIIAYNVDRKYKTVHIIKPLFYDTFPIYKGVLAEKYQEKKQKKMKQIRIDLFETIKDLNEGGLSERDKVISQMAEKFGASKVGASVGLSARRVNQIKKAQAEGKEKIAYNNWREGKIEQD